MRRLNHKKGFTLIELVVVMTIIMTITGVVIFSGARIIKSANISSLISEKNVYAEAIEEFYNVKNRIPGDVPLTEAAGDLNTTVIRANITKAGTNTGTNDTMGTGHIDGIKGVLGFQQMVATGLIPSTRIKTSYTNLYTCMNQSSENFAIIKDKLIPGIKYDKKIAWMIGMDKSGQTPQNSPKNSVLYNTNIYPKFQNQPRLILFMSGNYGATTYATCQVDVANTGIGFLGSAAIPADMAYEIDVKIDDGLPSSLDGAILSENDTGNGCTSTEADPTIRSYKSTTVNTGRQGCIMTFLVPVAGL